MPGGVESVLDRRVGCEEPLGRRLGLEPLLLSLALADGEVGVFRPVILPLFAIVMDVGKAEFSGG
jgi:hypothetical protein